MAKDKLRKAIQEIDSLISGKIGLMKKKKKEIYANPNQYTVGEMIRAESEYRGAVEIHIIFAEYVENILGFTESERWGKN